MRMNHVSMREFRATDTRRDHRWPLCSLLVHRWVHCVGTDTIETSRNIKPTSLLSGELCERQRWGGPGDQGRSGGIETNAHGIYSRAL
jgi:hypothetical protein